MLTGKCNTDFRQRINRHYELARKILTSKEIAEAKKFDFRFDVPLRCNAVYKSIQRVFYLHVSRFGERGKQTLIDTVKLKTIIDAYESTEKHKWKPAFNERECAMCGAMFRPVCEVRQVCDDCLYRNNGNDYARWYMERNPITITAESLTATLISMHCNERAIPMQSKSEAKAKARNY